MTTDWVQRWQDNRISFHQEKVNSRLVKFWPQLEIDEQAGVFVPLCGKSTDMVWLQQQGYQVIGNELSAIACEAFFRENDLTFNRTEGSRFTEFGNDHIRLLQGDFFDLSEKDLENTAAVFDRASLIALPEHLRIRYAKHLSGILRAGAKILLISMEYDQNKMKGPPFSISDQEVHQLFGDDFTIEILSHSCGPDIVGNLAERGLDTLDERVYLLAKI